ncbi:hypothetical protein K7X08_016776 [Anisodus acutangulus]|uniref:Uncharacterized protein n=1 Tax=Anisodus acutangulus TaxID=402998 RepID=A0A9Q1R685_9SOLA|nr:hypothetical protein K7X08_016776 [Anisodus acutangulus]
MISPKLFPSSIRQIYHKQEMESVFGEPPPSSISGSIDNQSMPQDLKLSTAAMDGKESFAGLTHIGNKGEAQMVDVSLKDISKRVAIARGKVILGRKVFDLVSANQMGK